MFGTLGGPEIAIIAVVLILLFGVGKISGLGKELGSSIKEFRRAVKDEDKEADKAEKAEKAQQAQAAQVQQAQVQQPAPPAQPQAPQQQQPPATPPPAATGDKNPNIF
jgi:sec-independent protein translocase protein TatA